MAQHVFFIQIATCLLWMFSSSSVAALPALGDPDTLRGRVRSSTNENSPIQGASVQWKGSKSGVFTDKQGRFVLVRPNGSDSLVCKSVGHKTVTLAVPDTTEIDIALLPESLSEVTVDAESGPTITKSVIKTETISKKDLTKAACCSLAESFEKNPSVEVSFSDAVSGAKQIQLLGLRGVYTQFLIEAVPAVRSIEMPFGLDHIPGPFMESISISKGASSVTTGYEAMTGQINICMHNPRTAPALYVNAYANTMERYDVNLYGAQQLTDELSTMTMAHVRKMDMGQDNNGDGFADIPTFRQANLVHRWLYNDDEVEWQVFVRGILDSYASGQGVVHTSSVHHPGDSARSYDISTDIQRLETFVKVGLLDPFDDLEEGSGLSLVAAGSVHEQNSAFGMRSTNGQQQTFQLRGIAALPFTTEFKVVTGFSYLYDNVREAFTIDGASVYGSRYDRIEHVPGLYAEATYEPSKDLTILGGIRNDWHNLYGARLVPRAHVKWNMNQFAVLRASAGRGWRAPAVINENLSSFINSRRVYFDSTFRPEDSWNAGVSVSTYFSIAERPVTVDAEVYHTTFTNQLIVDYDRSVREVWVTNLDGTSYATNVLLQAMVSPMAALDVVGAIRWVDVQAPYNGLMQQRPMMSRLRFLGTVSFAPKDWQFDATVSWNGAGRLPTTEGNIQRYRLDAEFPSYWRVNGQITRKFGQLEFYVGIENATNFIQSNPILGTDSPFGSYFDASLTWGPMDPQMVYTGVRYTFD
jgi:outer membrane cobalamin receptor